MKKTVLEFTCPSCGNPLYESVKPVVKCPYCQTVIVPRSRKLKREERIYEHKKKETEMH